MILLYFRFIILEDIVIISKADQDLICTYSTSSAIFVLANQIFIGLVYNLQFYVIFYFHFAVVSKLRFPYGHKINNLN